MHKILFFLLFGWCTLMNVNGQQTKEIHLVFQALFEEQELKLDQAVENDQDIQIETLRYYLSGVRLLENDRVVFTEKGSHHLLDIADSTSMTVLLDIPVSLQYDRLEFTLGVDSLTSSQGVFGGDLDPTNGMYWTWRSGYINFKLEGTSPLCPARKNRFQFHVGGYQAPYNSTRRVSLGVRPGKKVSVDFALDKFFRKVDLSQQYQLMSPSEESTKMADLLATLFTTRQ